MFLTAAIGRAIPDAPRPAALALPKPRALASRAPRALESAPAAAEMASVALAAPSDKPVLQLSALPVTVDPADLRDPQTPSTPNGSLASLYALRALVDPVPPFARQYAPTPSSTERIYDSIVRGAAPLAGESDFAAEAIATARKRLSDSVLATLGSTPDTWRPVFPAPVDFTDPSLYARIDVDLDRLAEPSGPYQHVGDESAHDELGWSTPNAPQRLDPDTSLGKLRCRCLTVRLAREWLDPTIFSIAGWNVPGQRAGFVSSGDIRDNRGLLPLLVSGLVLATDVEVTGAWRGRDRALLAAREAIGRPLALGPFSLLPAPGAARGSEDGALRSPSGIHVLGWISDLVPRAPG